MINVKKKISSSIACRIRENLELHERVKAFDTLFVDHNSLRKKVDDLSANLMKFTNGNNFHYLH